jgi:hypothetical protein
MRYLLVFLTACSADIKFKPDCQQRIILSVGGCNGHGYCGVLYDDMTYGREYYPVTLTQVEVCR